MKSMVNSLNVSKFNFDNNLLVFNKRVKKNKIPKDNKFIRLFSKVHLPILCFNETWLKAYEDTLQLKRDLYKYEIIEGERN